MMPMISLVEVDDELRQRGQIILNVMEISSVREHHYHSFRPPSGSVVTMQNGDVHKVSESVSQIERLILSFHDERELRT